MDRLVCIFNYRQGNSCLRLYTEGEDIKDMQVSHWSKDCNESP